MSEHFDNQKIRGRKKEKRYDTLCDAVWLLMMSPDGLVNAAAAANASVAARVTGADGAEI
jgi:hypothetical protein